jgi:hypothetical protein
MKTGGIGYEELKLIKEELTEGDVELTVWATKGQVAYLTFVRATLKKSNLGGVISSIKEGYGWVIKRVQFAGDEVWVYMERGYNVYPETKKERDEMAKKEKKG